MANKLEYAAQQQLLGTAPNPNEARLQREREQRERDREAAAREKKRGAEGKSRKAPQLGTTTRTRGAAAAADDDAMDTGEPVVQQRRDRNVAPSGVVEGGTAGPTRGGPGEDPAASNPFTRFGPLVGNLPPIPATQHPDQFSADGLPPGSPMHNLLSENVALMQQIRTQLLQGRLNDNVPMFMQFRENLFSLISLISQVRHRITHTRVTNQHKRFPSQPSHTRNRNSLIHAGQHDPSSPPPHAHPPRHRPQ